MKRIAIIGPKNCYTKATKVKQSLYKLKQLDPVNTKILSGGNEEGIELDVKKTALGFGLMYEEYNPSFTPHNQFSKYAPSNYGKKYHYTHLIARYERMLNNADVVVFGCDDNSNVDPLYHTILTKAQKKGKQIIFL